MSILGTHAINARVKCNQTAYRMVQHDSYKSFNRIVSWQSLFIGFEDSQVSSLEKIVELICGRICNSTKSHDLGDVSQYQSKATRSVFHCACFSAVPVSSQHRIVCPGLIIGLIHFTSIKCPGRQGTATTFTATSRFIHSTSLNCIRFHPSW